MIRLRLGRSGLSDIAELRPMSTTSDYGRRGSSVLRRRHRTSSVSQVIELDAATFLLQWSVGGMFGCWYTTRRREVGIGYGWLLRVVYGILLAASAVIGWASDETGSAIIIRNAMTVGTVLLVASGLVASIVRRRLRDGDGSRSFDPRLDLVVVFPGIAGLVAAAVSAGGSDVVAVARLLVGAAFLGLVTDAMLLGHWYLVQPGLPRRHVNDLVRVFLYVWPLEIAVMLIPTGMFSVFAGTVDDGWGGLLGWFWVACAATTGILAVTTTRALKEPSYSAVMAATGLMYLAILTAFGTDLVARAILS